MYAAIIVHPKKEFPCIIPADILTNKDTAAKFVNDNGFKLYAYDPEIKAAWDRVDAELSLVIHCANWAGDALYLTEGMVHFAFNMVNDIFYNSTFMNMCPLLTIRISDEMKDATLAVTRFEVLPSKYLQQHIVILLSCK